MVTGTTADITGTTTGVLDHTTATTTVFMMKRDSDTKILPIRGGRGRVGKGKGGKGKGGRPVRKYSHLHWQI